MVITRLAGGQTNCRMPWDFALALLPYNHDNPYQWLISHLLNFKRNYSFFKLLDIKIKTKLEQSTENIMVVVHDNSY